MGPPNLHHARTAARGPTQYQVDARHHTSMNSGPPSHPIPHAHDTRPLDNIKDGEVSSPLHPAHPDYPSFQKSAHYRSTATHMQCTIGDTDVKSQET